MVSGDGIIVMLNCVTQLARRNHLSFAYAPKRKPELIPLICDNSRGAYLNSVAHILGVAGSNPAGPSMGP